MLDISAMYCRSIPTLFPFWMVKWCSPLAMEVMAHRKMIKMMIKIMIDLNNGDVPYFQADQSWPGGWIHVLPHLALWNLKSFIIISHESSPINPPKNTSPSPKKRSSPKPSAQTRALPPRPPQWHQPQRHPPARWALARWARWGCQLHGCNGDVNLPKSFECWYFGSDNMQFFCM